MDLTNPVTQAFTQALPKIEPPSQLHAHLSGSISRQCLHEIWAAKKAQDPAFSIEDPWVIMPPGKVDYTLQTFFQVFSKSIYQLVTDAESIKYATTSVLNDFYNDGVRYLELRTTPRKSPDGSLSKEEYILTVLECISSFQPKSNQKKNQSQSKMTTNLILSIDRSNDTAADALETVNLAIAHRSKGIVGIDLCGNPSKGDVSIYRSAFEKARSAGLGITVHFGETASSGTKEELETLLSYNPDRLGHVIHVPDEVKEEIERRKLGLELCMSCNVHAKMIDGGFLDHHFGHWRCGECPVVLSTDDVGFFCSPVSNEYVLAASHFELSRKDILRICRKGIEAIFGGCAEKNRLWGLVDEFEGVKLESDKVDCVPSEADGCVVKTPRLEGGGR
ncbi:adenosine deaminase [Aspergillus sclerotialis]|uniref:Adenosine deaminase n=1 Tax=Aspergillus sclerotialis TaxID=2070753 RepID=A0A3A2Z7P5_9EURO|nr:adenosine deaminase [Aspergillus sclerotialis]